MTNRVTAFVQGNLTNSQYFEASVQLRGIFGTLPDPDATVADILADFSTAVDHFSGRLNLERQSQFVLKRNQLDDLRDSLFVGLAEIARNLSRTDPDPNWRDAATLIVQAIDKREEGFYRLSNAENTAELRLLFDDLNQPAAQSALTLIGLQRFYTPLKQANADFEANEVEARQTPQPDDNLPLMRTIKRNLSRKAALLLEIIEHFVEKNRQPYVNLMQQCYEVITQVRSVAKARETREAAAAAAAAPDAPAAG